MTGGIALAMLGVTVALSAAADQPVDSADVGMVLDASAIRDRANAYCANCGARFDLPRN